MEAKDFQNDVIRTLGYPAIAHACMGIASESGELLQVVRKREFEASSSIPYDREALLDELGDVLRYSAALLNAVGSTFEEVFYKNSEKVKKRGTRPIESFMAFIKANPPEDLE